MNQEEYSKDAVELLAQIGITLIQIQDMEYCFSACMKLVFPDDLPRSMEQFLKEERRPFGALLKEMKKTVEVGSEFDSLLRRTVEDRNLFVHRLRLQPWYDIHTEEGRNATWGFLGPLSDKVIETTRVFHAFLWQMHQNCGIPETENESILRKRGFIQDLEQNYVPFLDQMAAKKETN